MHAEGSDAEQLHRQAVALFEAGNFRHTYRALSLAITKLHMASTSDDDLSPRNTASLQPACASEPRVR